MRKILIAFSFSSLFFCQTAWARADLLADNTLNSIESFIVDVNDGVTDGCLPNPTTLSEVAEREVLDAGFNLGNSESINALLIVNPFGFGTDSGICVVSLKISIRRYLPSGSLVSDGSNEYFTFLLGESDYVVSSSKYNMQDVLRKKTIAHVRSLLLPFMKARARSNRLNAVSHPVIQ